MSKNIKDTTKTSVPVQIIIIAILLLFAFMQIFPFYLQIVSALQPLDLVPEIGKIYLLPVSINFGNFLESLQRVDLLVGVKNSLIVAIGFTGLSSIVVLIVGYVLGKKTFKGKTFIKFCMLLTMVVPGEMLLVTNYLLVSSFKWTNSFAGLILPGIINISGIFIVMSFMNTIPNAVLEAAEIDGAGELGKIFRIVLPMSVPVISTYCILTVIAQWNDYLWPMVITQDSSMFTVQLKLKEFNPYYFGFADDVLKAAAYTMTIVPVIIIYLLCQKQFIGGLSISGMK